MFSDANSSSSNLHQRTKSRPPTVATTTLLPQFMHSSFSSSSSSSNSGSRSSFTNNTHKMFPFQEKGHHPIRVMKMKMAIFMGMALVLYIAGSYYYEYDWTLPKEKFQFNSSLDPSNIFGIIAHRGAPIDHVLRHKLNDYDMTYNAKTNSYEYRYYPYSMYTDGTFAPVITPYVTRKSDELARERRGHVKRAMQHVWTNYNEFAFGKDEILPVSGKSGNLWGNQATTLIDSLDTLWIMGMSSEFEVARNWVRDKLDFNNAKGEQSTFEITIRSLGGLLSAYFLSEDEVFLNKAKILGSRIFCAFHGGTDLIPDKTVDVGRNKCKDVGNKRGQTIAEVGTLQLEFRSLSRLTGELKFENAAMRVFEELLNANVHGLYPISVNDKRVRKNTQEIVEQKQNPFTTRNRKHNGSDYQKMMKGGRRLNEVPASPNENQQFVETLGLSNKISLGGNGDSFYEYILKLWLQGGRKEPTLREMYDKSIDAMHERMLSRSKPSNLLYLNDIEKGNMKEPKMQHLACFMGGLLALGAYTDPRGLESERAQRDLTTAKSLTYTCYQMYARTNSGLSPEEVHFENGIDFFVESRADYYILRPETVESFFILNSLTGDPVYREWGWDVFQAIEKVCKQKYGYSEIHRVSEHNVTVTDKMESFFPAETLKYLYLLFDPDTKIDVLNKHVFNTEAHPFLYISP